MSGIRPFIRRITEWRWLFSLQGIGIIHVSRKREFSRCVFPQSAPPWSSLTVRSYGRRTESRTKQQSWTIIHKRDLRRFQRILRICLFRHSRYSAFCLLHLQALRHSFGLRLATINETKVWHWKSSFDFFSGATFDHLR